MGTLTRENAFPRVGGGGPEKESILRKGGEGMGNMDPGTKKSRQEKKTVYKMSEWTSGRKRGLRG